MKKIRRPGVRQRLSARMVAGGFTLVEVLVALMIMAILATMAWQGIDGIVRSRDISNAQLQRTLLINTVLAQWEKDLASLQDTPAVPPLTFDGASLRLTRRAPGGVQVVVWSLRSSSVLQTLPGAAPPVGMVWQRWAGPVVTLRNDLQQSWLLSQQLQGDEPGHLRLLDGIEQWQLFYFRGNAWTNAQSSGDQKAGTTFVPSSVQAPDGIRLLLQIGNGQLSQGSLSRDVMMGPQA